MVVYHEGPTFRGTLKKAARALIRNADTYGNHLTPDCPGQADFKYSLGDNVKALTQEGNWLVHPRLDNNISLPSPSRNRD